MRSKKPSIGLTAVLAMFAVATLMTGTRAAAQTENVLYNFTFNNNGADGIDPVASLIFDASGNLYGTTNQGGTYNDGTVFELTPQVGGVWTETVLHSFQGTDGAGPGRNGGLIFDAARQSLRHGDRGRRLRLRNGVRVDPQCGWGMDRDGAA